MDKDRLQRIQQEAKRDFFGGRGRLCSVVEMEKIKRELREDEERLFALFKAQELGYGLQCSESLKRIVLNYCKLASYKGIREGISIQNDLEEIQSDRAKHYVLTYLLNHPKAKNEELVAYLDGKNGRLATLRTSRSSPHWAPLPQPLQKLFVKHELKISDDDGWQTAIDEFPGQTRIYFSRIRQLSKDNRIRNILEYWPSILKRHKRERKAQ
jgi:hypothetical protein